MRTKQWPVSKLSILSSLRSAHIMFTDVTVTPRVDMRPSVFARGMMLLRAQSRVQSTCHLITLGSAPSRQQLVSLPSTVKSLPRLDPPGRSSELHFVQITASLSVVVAPRSCLPPPKASKLRLTRSPSSDLRSWGSRELLRAFPKFRLLASESLPAGSSLGGCSECPPPKGPVERAKQG